MVRFYLISIIGNIATYEYYPDGDKSKACGIITLNTESGEIILVQKSEDGYLNDAQHAMDKIEEYFEKGEIPEYGIAAWC